MIKSMLSRKQSDKGVLEGKSQQLLQQSYFAERKRRKSLECHRRKLGCVFEPIEN
jgi:hypothetical protein